MEALSYATTWADCTTSMIKFQYFDATQLFLTMANLRPRGCAPRSFFGICCNVNAFQELYCDATYSFTTSKGSVLWSLLHPKKIVSSMSKEHVISQKFRALPRGIPYSRRCAVNNILCVGLFVLKQIKFGCRPLIWYGVRSDHRMYAIVCLL